MSRLDLADGLRLIEEAKTSERFGHREHLRFAWSVLEESESLEEAERVVAYTIRHVATAVGDPGKYNHTLTIFWMRVLARRRESSPHQSLDELMEGHPELTDTALPERHWTDINSPAARRGWIEPDLEPLR